MLSAKMGTAVKKTRKRKTSSAQWRPVHRGYARRALPPHRPISPNWLARTADDARGSERRSIEDPKRMLALPTKRVRTKRHGIVSPNGEVEGPHGHAG